jgi:glycosyltransferase involved in cell wall biosynthesis
VVPRHSACEEIWQDGGVLIDIDRRYVPSFAPLEMATVAPAAVGRALTRLYVDDQYRQAMSKAAYATALRSCYTWDAVAAQWAQVIHETIDAVPRDHPSASHHAGR